MISGLFLDIMPNKYNIKNFSGYHSVEKPPKKLLEQVSDVIRLKHYSYKTEKSYVNWIKRYIIFHDKRHPQEMGGREIEEFLTHLAVEENVAASTQNQALNAILFLYKEVLKQELDLQVDAVRAKRSRYLPTVLTKEEVLAIIDNLSGVYQLVVKLLYGTGLRQTECLQLRVKDLDFAQKQLIVRDAKKISILLKNSLLLEMLKGWKVE
ncbi:phage integrase N-terminal SAM-like domain-containing protein [Pleurocapsales cyanobacterium LEGE 06147]|nr:phage integrase N-terminal SAM-like domain-containing protein [Pleurocapsales cyanobacterium LEGE 06147]